MSRKGFTLVELLAVIAILAILVIIALPNILDLFKSAKKNAFYNEVQSVYDSAKKQYLLGQFGNNNGSRTFTNIGGEDQLSIQNGTGDFKYCITVDSNGYVTSINVTNGEYKYEDNDTSNKANISNVSNIDSGYKFSCNGIKITPIKFVTYTT